MRNTVKQAELATAVSTLNTRIDGLSTVVDGTLIDTYKSTDCIAFNFDGTVIPTVSNSRWYPYTNITLKSIYFSVEAAGTDNTVLQLNVNGVAVGGVVTCTTGAFKSDTITLNTAVTTNDYVSVDIIDGNSARNVSVVVSYDLTSNLPIATIVQKGVVSVGDGLAITAEGVLSATGGGGSGTGLTVLNDQGYFLPQPETNGDTYHYVSIGTGNPGAAPADFVDIYAFADFINSASIQSYSNAIYAYFKEPGVVKLTKDLFFTNSQTFGSIFIQGAGRDGIGNHTNGDPQYSPWEDTVWKSVTAIVSSTPHTSDGTTHNGDFDVVVTLNTTTSMFVGGVLSIYHQRDVGGPYLPKTKSLMGTYTVMEINGNNVTLRGYNKGVTFDRAVDLAPIAGLTGIDAAFNRTVIEGKKSATAWSGHWGVFITGAVGNANCDGGFYNIAFSNTKVYLTSPQASVTLYENVHFRDARFRVYPGGYVETWGDVFTDIDYYIQAMQYAGWSDHHFVGIWCILSITLCAAEISKIRMYDPNCSYGAFAKLITYAPDIGTTAYVPPATTNGSQIIVL